MSYTLKTPENLKRLVPRDLQIYCKKSQNSCLFSRETIVKDFIKTHTKHLKTLWKVKHEKNDVYEMECRIIARFLEVQVALYFTTFGPFGLFRLFGFFSTPLRTDGWTRESRSGPSDWKCAKNLWQIYDRGSTKNLQSLLWTHFPTWLSIFLSGDWTVIFGKK